MRILYFSRDYTSHDYRFLSALAQSPYEVFYLRLERGMNQYESRPLPPAVNQVRWAGGHRPAKWQDALRLLRDLKRVIKEFQPGLVLAGPLQRTAFLTALCRFHPLVSMSWGYDLIHDARKNPLWAWATRYTLKHSDALVGDCALIRQLAEHYGMPGDRIVTFPWGIDLKHFSPGMDAEDLEPAHGDAGESPRDEHPCPFTLLSTRSWEPIYGVDVLARAFVLAARQRPELQLVMLGNGSQAALLRQIFTQGGVLHPSEAQSQGMFASRVLFPGQASYADLPRWYRSADLYIAATHSDGTSISLLEAMACGRAVLVSDIPGNREWIVPEANGWLFPNGDSEVLARAIVKAVDERTRLPAMGQAARQVAEERADWDTNFQKLSQAFRIALIRTGRSQPVS